MQITIREFQRNFRAIRQRARAGEEILIADRDGQRFRFRVEESSTPATFGAQAADLAGSFASGQGDLASDPRHLAEYGRK